MRVTPSGSQSSPFIICNRTDRQANPDLLFDGQNFIVVWTDEGAGTHVICGARVTPQGQVLDPNGKLLIGGTISWGSPRLAFDGANLMMAYKEGSISSGRVYGQRLTTDLDKIGDSFPISNSTQRKEEVRIAYSGVNYLVAWMDRSFLNFEIKGRLVAKDGTVIGNDISIATGLSQGSHFDLTFDGVYYLLVYSNGTTINGQKVATDGNLVGSAFPIGSGNFPTVCYAQGNLLINYSKMNSDYDIYGTTDFTQVSDENVPSSADHRIKTIYAGAIRANPGDRFYDCLGRPVRPSKPGVYFLKRSNNTLIKVIKIR